VEGPLPRERDHHGADGGKGAGACGRFVVTVRVTVSVVVTVRVTVVGPAVCVERV